MDTMETRDDELARLRAELAEALAAKARAEALALDLAAALAKKVNEGGPAAATREPVDDPGALEPPVFRADASTPPWRQRAWAQVTDTSLGNDVEAYRMFAQAVVEADDARTLDELAEKLGVAKRTLQRARDWIRVHDPKLWARLRAREPGRPGDE